MSPLRAHLASPCAHSRILHAQFPSYLPGLPRMTPPSFFHLRPHPAIQRSLPTHVAEYLREMPGPCSVCSASRRPPAITPLSPLPPSQSAGDSLPLSLYVSIIHHLPASSSRLSIRQPLTCAPSAGPPTARVLLLTIWLTLTASRRCLCACTPLATASAFTRRSRSTKIPAATEGRPRRIQRNGRAAQKNHGILRIRATAATRIGRICCLAPGPAPGGKLVSERGSCRRQRMAMQAWARAASWPTMVLR